MEHQDLLDRVHRLHFIRIGGSGMCPMAEILHGEGFLLTGSDVFESDTLQRIRSYGIPVYMGHKAENIGDAEAVVYTAAVKQDNPELAAAREKGDSHPGAQRDAGHRLPPVRHAVAVSGTHGKTTTTAMLTQILVQSGKDPNLHHWRQASVFWAGTAAWQQRDYGLRGLRIVDTFLQLTPAVSVILNIDADHLDYLKPWTILSIPSASSPHRLPKRLVVNGDDGNTQKGD